MYVTKSQFFWGVMFMVAIFSMTTLDFIESRRFYLFIFITCTGVIFALASAKED